MKTSWTTRAVVIVALAGFTLAACSSKHSGGANAGAAPPSSAPPSSAPPSSASPSSARPSAATSSSPQEPTSSASSPARVPAGFEPVSVTFVSPDDGFVLGVAPCATGSCTTLVTTADAGKTWRAVSQLRPSLVGDNPAVSKVRFATPRDGWAFGPQLWTTHDGGETWRQINEPQPVSDLEAAAGVAYALVGDQLLRTPVSADTWREVRRVGASAMIAMHGHAIWVVERGGPGDTTLLASADGATWKILPDPCAASGSDWALAGVAPVTASQLFLLCGGDGAAGSESKKVLFSSDAGRTNTAASDPPRGGIASAITAASASVVAVVASSGASEIYRSGDAGKTWQTPLQQGDGGLGYYDVGFTTATQGVAIYGRPGQPNAPHPQLLMTHDAGVTWPAVRF